VFLRLGASVLRARVLIVIVWAVAAVASVLLAPPLSSVTATGTAGFLPAGSASRLAADRLAARFPEEAGSASATIVLFREGGLTDADHALAATIAERLRADDAPAVLRDILVSVQGAADASELAALYRSPDGAVELLDLRMTGSAYGDPVKDAVDAIRVVIANALPPTDAPEVSLTGNAAIARDYLGAITEGTDRTTLVTVALVVVILLLIYRAPVAALVPLITIGAAFGVARGVLGVMAQAGWQIPSLLDTFIVVIVFGVGTDYAIFLLSRHREELARLPRAEATVVTVGRIGEVITASAATVIVALLSMAVASFGMIQTIGPALAVAVAVTLVAGLTLTPALAVLAGRWLTWPRHEVHAGEAAVRDGAWDRLGRFVVRRPGLVSTLVLAGLLIPVLAVPSMRVEFDALQELPATMESRRGFDRVADHVDRGSLLPVTILLESPDGTDWASPTGLATLAAAGERLAATDGVRAVRTLVSPTGDGSIADALRPSVTLRTIADGLGAMTGGGLAPDALAILEDPATLARVDTAVAYLDGLARAFPDLAATEPLAGLVADTHALRDAIATYGADGATATARQAALLALITVSTGLPDALAATAAVFAGRPDDLYLPVDAAPDPTLAWLLATRRSADRAATRISVVTVDEPYAVGAFDTVRRLRALVADPTRLTAGAPGSLVPIDVASVAGPTAESADVQAVIGEDFRRVGLITVLGILVVLALLLRSLVAPIYLVATVLLSYATTLGLSTLLFQGVLGHRGVDYFVPLIVFVLLVALGSDYNIFLMSRVREESTGADLRAGIAVASARTGTVITSAGIILAGTFLALIAAPLVILEQTGLAVAMGVLIDTFVVRSLLIPALTALIGEWAWWPSVRSGSAPPRPQTTGSSSTSA
jgi:RND superfamily putative drug exporter